MLDNFDGFDHFDGFSNLDGDWSRNLSWAGNSTGFSQASYNSASTFGVINEFKFLAARSIRTSTIILASFNTLSAFTTAAGILYDCYTTEKRANTGGKRKVNIFTCVRGPEIYPFFVSVGITIQGIIFAVAQAQGLTGLFTAGCSLISQFMWPALFIVPYVQLVFALEITFRSLRTRPFPTKGKWDVAICLAIIKVLLVITGLVAFFIPAPSFCFASLFWFVARWAEGGFAVLLGIAVTLMVCAIIIFFKLTRYSYIEETERMAASRMVYYLALAVVSNALMVPFFVYLTFSNPFDNDGDSGLTLSMIATVVANVTGLMTGGLHLFLRSRTTFSIGPSGKMVDYERQQLKYKIRMQSPSETDFNSHILQPVAAPRPIPTTGSQESLVEYEKDIDVERGPIGVAADPNPLRSNAVYHTPFEPRAPEPAQLVSNPTSHMHSRKPSASYKLFPNERENNTTSTLLLPSTTYNPEPSPAGNQAFAGFQFYDSDNLLKPPSSTRVPGSPIRSPTSPFRPPGSPFRPPGARHRRDSSLASSATVQIGLRLSNVNDMPPMAARNVSDAERVYSLDIPRPDPATYFRPTQLERISSAAASVESRDPAGTTSAEPTLHGGPQVPQTEDTGDCTLNPTVYDPNSPSKSKVPSPRGVGFSIPQRSNTQPALSSAARSQRPHKRGNSAAAENTGDWI
ncbi:hypothetical protein F4780DRAFT_604646 [Xylariomycetidae sp. FL0641]|nr:hypothetical protein F4780DRAFT_604646 [Xylariomycetidae sp. FL0641]